MKVLLNIDQTASLTAGLEAPSSTILLEISAADISPEDRAFVMPQYTLATGCFSGSPDYDRSAAGWPDLPPAVMPAVMSDCDGAGALAAIHEYAESLRARAAALAEATAAHKASLAAAAEATAEARRIDREGVVAGTIQVRSVTESGIHTPTGFFHEKGDDIATAMEAAAVAMNQQAAEKVEREATAAAEVERAKKAKDLARYAARLESGEWTLGRSSYNERRYSAWWCAKLDFSACTTKADPAYAWGESDATHGSAGTLTVPCVPGDFIAYGQKDLRKPRDTKHHFLRMRADGSMEEFSSAAECYRVVKSERKQQVPA